MKRALIFGNNTIGQFLISGLNILGFDAVDITDIEDISAKFDQTNQPTCIIDVTNAVGQLDEEGLLYHNNEGLTELLMYSARYKIPFMFLYKEPENFAKDHSLTFAFDSIDKFARKSTSIAKIQIEDIYGIDINTSEKLFEMVNALQHGESIRVEDDLTELYFLHQKDFMSGMIACLKEIQGLRGKKLYTLFPENSITEIELAHLASDIVGYDCDIEYLSDVVITKNFIVDMETTYPQDWIPMVELEEGITELLTFNGIKIKKLSDSTQNHELEKANDENEDKDSFDEATNEKTSYLVTDLPSNKNPLSNDEAEDIEDALQSSENHDVSDIFENAKVEEVPTKLEPGAKYYRPQRTNNDESNSKNPHVKSRKKEKAKKVAVILSALLLIATAFPSISFTYQYKKSADSIININNLIREKEYKTALIDAKKNLERTNLITDAPFYVKILSFIQKKPNDLLSENIDVIKKTALMQKYVSQAYLDIESLSKIEQTETFGFENSVLGIQTEGDDTVQISKIRELSIDLSQSQYRDTFISGTDMTAAKDYLIQTSKLLSKIDSEELRMLLGYGTSQNLLYFTQDPDELKATGGSIELIGIVDITDGQLNFSKPMPISEIDDGAILNNVLIDLSPEPIKNINNFDYLLPSEANWHPDFTKTSDMLLKFYKLTQGEVDLDGVLGLSQETYIRITDNGLSNAQKFDLLIESFQNGTANISHTNGQLKSWIAKNNWDGGLMKYKDDYLLIVDTNLSGHKISQNIKRGTTLTLPNITDDSQYIRDLTLNYENKNPFSSDKSTVYTGNVRVYTPKDAMLNSAYILNSGEKTTITRSVETYVESDYNVFAFDIEIEPQQKMEIVLQYQSVYKTPAENTRNFLIQKQNGTKEENFKMIITYPLGLPENSPSGFSRSGNSFIREQILEGDTYFDIPL